jgi:hypothetical protein
VGLLQSTQVAGVSVPTAPAVPGSPTDTPDGVDLEAWRALARVPVKRLSFTRSQSQRSKHSPEDPSALAPARKDEGDLRQSTDALLARLLLDQAFPKSKRYSFRRLPKAGPLKKYRYKLDPAAASDVAAGDLVGAWQMGSGQVTFTLNANGLPLASLLGMNIELAPIVDEGRSAWGAENDVLGIYILRAFTRDHVSGTISTPDRDEDFMMTRLTGF